MRYLVVVLGVLLQMSPTRATSRGALKASCPDLRPHHGVPAETSPSPYVVLLSKTSYNPGDQIEVTLEGRCNHTFKGFLLQARRADPKTNTAEYIGSFSPIKDTHAICDNGDGVPRGLTQSNPKKRSVVKVLWTAPSTHVGYVIFKATFVQEYSRYWMGINSAVLHDPTAPTLSVPENSLVSSTMAPCTSTSSATPSTSSPTSSLTSTTASHQPPQGLHRDKQCQITLGCFDDCTSTGCTFTVTWEEEGDNIHFRLKSVSSGNSWMAIGFSDDELMGNDSVTECVVYGGVVKVFQSFDEGRTNTRLADAEIGISSTSGSVINDVFECSFLRQTVVAGDDKIFNLTNNYHMMYAHGTSLPGFWKIPHQHGDHKVTSYVINFQSIDRLSTAGTVSSPSSEKPTALGIFKSTECGISQGCFDDCDTGCTFTVTWAEEGDNIRFGLRSYSPGNTWMAVGFSSDKIMGDDAVVECVVYNGVVKAFESRNTDSYDNVRLSNPEVGLSDVKGSVSNGVFDCSLLRQIGVQGNDEVFNLTQEWYLMFAFGDAMKDFKKRPHTVRPSVTSAQVDFRKFASAVRTTLTYPLVQAHGSLMCIAWLFCASIALVLARYYKPMWPDTTLGGVKVWFQLHRSCMGLTFLLTVAAFIIIFIEAQGYSKINGEDYEKSHPILGIIVTALVIINPVMAYFRPGPKAERRPLFNWAHFLVGIGAYIMAGLSTKIAWKRGPPIFALPSLANVITIFFGMELSKAGAPYYMKYILAGYVAWQLIVEACLETLECFGKQKESQTSNIIQMQSPSTKEKSHVAPAPSGPHFVSTKQLILVLHVCVVLGATATVIILLVAV